MKHTLTFLFTLLALHVSAQDRFTRIYNQDTAGTGNYYYGNCSVIQTTADGGHLLQFYPYASAYDGPEFAPPVVIKTDSNFYPQWKQFWVSVPLSVGAGIIHCYNPQFIDQYLNFEKTDLSGTPIWMKKLVDNDSSLTHLFSPVYFNGIIRYVGNRIGSNYTPAFIDIDTLGNLIAADTVAGDSTTFENQFSDDSGNYYFLQTSSFNTGNRQLTKLRPDNSIVWSYLLYKPVEYDVTGMVTLPNGDVVISGNYHYFIDTPTIFLIKLSPTGSLIWQKSARRHGAVSAMQILNNGNIILSATGNGYYTPSYNFSSSVIEIDTAANVIWARNIEPDITGFPNYIALSPPYIRSNNDWYFTAIKRGPYAPIVYNTDSMGNGHCTSAPIEYSFADSSLFTLIPTTLSFAPFAVTISVVPTMDSVLPQLFVDSCDYAIPASVANITASLDINIYPNPASNTFSIQNATNIANSDIFDMAGRLVKSVTYGFDKIDIAGLKDGHYIIRLIRKDNTITYKKLVVIN